MPTERVAMRQAREIIRLKFSASVPTREIARHLGVAPSIVRCERDENSSPAAIKSSDAEMAALNILRDAFHCEWNYTIAPSNQLCEAAIS